MGDAGLGICVIGRNEGARLREVLGALRGRGERRVYVDSASTDDSVGLARSAGGEFAVLELASDRRCTAALGRNEGFAWLWDQVPGLEFVQFVDGDCVLSEGWLEAGMEVLRDQPDVAIVAGRLREQYRDRNRYHRLADMEWNTEVGDVDTTGGICMVRASLYHELGGMNVTVSAGEEAELARRVRARGYRVVRLSVEMARHDIDMNTFAQWWTRTVREGKAVAAEVHREGGADGRALRHLLSMLGWGVGVPVLATGLALPSLGLSLGLFAGYPVLWKRARCSRLRYGDSPEDATLYATATVVGKVANAGGVIRYVAGQAGAPKSG